MTLHMQLIRRQCQDHFHLVQKYAILDDLEGAEVATHVHI